MGLENQELGECSLKSIPQLCKDWQLEFESYKPSPRIWAISQKFLELAMFNIEYIQLILNSVQDNQENFCEIIQILVVTSRDQFSKRI